MPNITPMQAAPNLMFPLVGGTEWNIQSVPVEKLLMIVVYRGLHCPVCKTYLRTLNRLQETYADIGVGIVTVSADTLEKAAQSKQDWELDVLDIGYALSETQMRAWDMFVSHSVRDAETAVFPELAFFLIRPDRTIYYSAINSMPFGRPDLKALVSNITWLLDNDYPARGEA